MVKDKFVDLGNARLEEQRQVMEQIISDGGCPFCPKNLSRYHTQPILQEGKYWRVTVNQWPYEHTRVQLLAIYRDHAETIGDVNPEAGRELFEIMAWFEVQNAIPGGALAMRFGDTRFSAGSVKHIHVQLIVPDLTDPEYLPVRFKIGGDNS